MSPAVQIGWVRSRGGGNRRAWTGCNVNYLLADKHLVLVGCFAGPNAHACALGGWRTNVQNVPRPPSSGAVPKLHLPTRLPPATYAALTVHFYHLTEA